MSDGRANIHPHSAFAQKLAAQRHRDKAYDQRDEVIAALSKQFDAHLMPSTMTRLNWSWVVCIHLPTGQVAWTISDESALENFAHLPRLDVNHWDKHTHTTRSNRLALLPSRKPA